MLKPPLKLCACRLWKVFLEKLQTLIFGGELLNSEVDVVPSLLKHFSFQEPSRIRGSSVASVMIESVVLRKHRRVIDASPEDKSLPISMLIACWFCPATPPSPPLIGLLHPAHKLENNSCCQRPLSSVGRYYGSSYGNLSFFQYFPPPQVSVLSRSTEGVESHVLQSDGARCVEWLLAEAAEHGRVISK